MSPEQWVEFVTEFGEQDSIIREGAEHLRQVLADRDALRAELDRTKGELADPAIQALLRCRESGVTLFYNAEFEGVEFVDGSDGKRTKVQPYRTGEDVRIPHYIMPDRRLEAVGPGNPDRIHPDAMDRAALERKADA